MSLIIGFLTFFLILDCVFLVFLVLLQLPKKEAGAGVAFGGGATDALFGAGSGNMLTKITKWTAGIFFGLCIVLAVLTHHSQTNNANDLKSQFASQPAPKSSLPANSGLMTTPTNEPPTSPTPKTP